ncbi:hypothetical protein ACFL14_02945 [Patescibacteria group bacterium]
MNPIIRKINLFWIFSLVILCVFCAIFGVLFIKAEDNDSIGVSVSPPIMEVSANPGETIEKQIKLTNPLSREVRFYPLVYDFIAQGEEGRQTFLPPTAESRTFSLASWIFYNRSVISLAPNEEDTFDFKINIPNSAEPGGHYGVVFFSTDPSNIPARPGQVSVSGMVGSLILARVSGDIREKAEIIEFSAPRWSFSGPIKFVTRIENLGNVHFKPRGTINISDWRGENVDSLDMNPKTGNILPESIRRFENQWVNQGRWGRFTAKVSTTYGSTGEKLESRLVFWIIPIYILIIIGLVIILLVVFTTWLIRRSKPNKKTQSKESERPKIVKRLIQ